MDTAAIISLVVTATNLAIKYAPQVWKTAMDAKPFAVELFELYKGNKPTPAEITTLETEIDNLAARLQIPLSPAKPGDPDFTG